MFRSTVSRILCESSQHALRVSSETVPSPLTSSITVRSGLCNLADICVAQASISVDMAELLNGEASQESSQVQSEVEALSGDDQAASSSQIQENVEMPPDLLPVQSPQAVSAMLTQNLHIHTGSIRRQQPAREVPQDNNRSGNGNGQGCFLTFRRNSVYINPPPEHNYLHPYDTRHPSAPSNPEEIFARLMEHEELISDTVDDFEFHEGVVESPNSSGFFSRSDSMNEDDQNPVALLETRVSEILARGRLLASSDPVVNGNSHDDRQSDPPRAPLCLSDVLKMGSMTKPAMEGTVNNSGCRRCSDFSMSRPRSPGDSDDDEGTGQRRSSKGFAQSPSFRSSKS